MADELFEGAEDVKVKFRVKTKDGKILTGTHKEHPEGWDADGLAEFVDGKSVKVTLTLPPDKDRKVNQSRTGLVHGKKLGELILASAS